MSRYASKSPGHLNEIIETYSNGICIPMNDKFLHMYTAKLFIQLYPPVRLDEWPLYQNELIHTPYITTNTFFERLSIIYLIYSHFKVPISWSLLRFNAFISCMNAIRPGNNKSQQLRVLLKTVIFYCPLYPCCFGDIFCINCFYRTSHIWICNMF